MSKRTTRLWALLAALPLAAQAQAQVQPSQVDLTNLDRDMAGPRAQVLVLGTVHLGGAPKDFKPAALDGVLNRLAAYKPDIITVEDEPGVDCDVAMRQPAKYGADFCTPPDAARAATGLDIPAALTEIDKTLKAWAGQAAAPTPAQRRRLAAAFQAANEPSSSYVQWLQLPEAERRPGDGLDATLADTLRKLEKRNNESFLLAARLAARLGLQRVHPVDNHTGDIVEVADRKALGDALQAAWADNRDKLTAMEKEQAQALRGADVLPLYRSINTPAHARMLAEANIVGPMRSQAPGRYAQIWVGGWEIRNLRMVANIRETFRERPGARVLSIVGAPHKPWFDSWLGQLQGVDIVDAESVLK